MLRLLRVEDARLEVVGHELRIQGVPVGKAVVMNRHVILAQPSDGLADVLDRLADGGNYDVAGFRKA